jgi:hypothetical protein
MANVFEALEGEWRRLRRDRGAAASLAEVCRQAGGAVTLADVERYVRQASPADADQVLLALASRVVATPTPQAADPDPGTHPPDRSDGAHTGPGDDRAVMLLAARVMLQLLLPGTRKLARRWWALGDHDERAAAAVAAVYHHIRTYPLTRRPARIAANILMDAAYDLRRTLPRAITIPVHDPTTLHHPATTNHPGAATHDPNPAEELAHLLTDAIADGTLHPADAQLIARTRIAGHHINDIATERNRTPRTMWHRRKNAETTLTTTPQPT